MLDTDTKRRIDTARDILVGKVPDPKSQVEQITIALIYKFMDDMDAEAEELGGKRKFFAGEFARYGWAKLMRSGLGGHETLNLYAEAIAKMPENPGIPPLFRDIFKNAYLPYRDPETLRAFLKIIDEFTYDHSERLGDAFEYLLSVLGSQGDAGQFRTPRHIIDFIVEVVDPKKHETVLDPACGTAGFLISSFKHILKANTDEDGNSTLTPDDKGRLAQNFKGYDISPDMVRLSLVNMYLHGFTDPHIDEYDTLTSQDRWNEHADVILANPPFMSPKGGIKPHNRFSVQSKRSEVLFVDYIAEHLTPGGRAGIIVPEGIIFQSQTAYTQLRKMLVEEYLVAVVSLPAGVFNPYSGVKTSILILDKSLARQTQSIAFFKIENDGYSLGAQRREIDKNDLPETQQAIREYLNMDEQDRQDLVSSCASCPSMLKQLLAGGKALVVPKEKIAANGDYNLSGERYREGKTNRSTFPLVPLGELFSKIGNGVNVTQVDTKAKYRVTRIQTIADGSVDLAKTKFTDDEVKPESFLQYGDILLSHINSFDHLGKSAIFLGDDRDVIHGINLIRFVPDTSRINPLYAIRIFKTERFIDTVKSFAQKAVNQASVKTSDLRAMQIPLPPLEVQKEIVAEIEGYQKVIDGARAVLDNYRPHIPIHPDWPMVDLGEVCDLYQPKTIAQKDLVDNGPYLVFGANGVIGRYDQYNHEDGEVLITCRGATCGTVNISAPKSWITGNAMVVKPKDDRITKEFLFWLLKGSDLSSTISGSAQPQITRQSLAPFKIPLPPIRVQGRIVAEIEAEQALINANRELIARMEKKIQATLARIWGAE
jgi:type I restriction enzyme M protein